MRYGLGVDCHLSNTPMPLHYEQKQVPPAFDSTKEVDVESRIVSGYYASFGNVDSQGDRFAEDAFDESIAAWGPEGRARIKHLNQHDFYEPVGKPLVLRADTMGLYFETEITQDPMGDKVLARYALDLFEHSVGFDRREAEPLDEGATLITSAWLWEGSNVTWGANSQTPFMGFKGRVANLQEAATLIERLHKSQSRVADLLNQPIDDELAYQLELATRQQSKMLTALEDFMQGQPQGKADGLQRAADEPQEKAGTELEPLEVSFFGSQASEPISFFNQH